jgi:hypothetical protein
MGASMVSTPFLKSALTFSEDTPSGRVMVLLKLPKKRSDTMERLLFSSFFSSFFSPDMVRMLPFSVMLRSFSSIPGISAFT